MEFNSFSVKCRLELSELALTNTIGKRKKNSNSKVGELEWHSLLWTEYVISKSFFKAQIPSLMVLRGGAFGGVIRFKSGQQGRILMMNLVAL